MAKAKKQSFLYTSELLFVAAFVLGLILLAVVVLRTQNTESVDNRSKAAMSEELSEGDDLYSLERDLRVISQDDEGVMSAVDALK